MKRRTTPQGEEGSALILALVFITTIAVMVTAVLSFSEFGIRMTLRSRDQRAEAYAVDGAMEAAINRGVCANYSEGQLPQLNAPTTEVSISCGPFTDAVPVGAANKPKRAVLTLGADASDDGIHQLAGTGPVVTKGGIFSRSTVSNDNSGDARSLIVQGDVSAVGDCDGSIVATLTPLRCADQEGGPAAPADGADPNYPKATSTVPPPMSVPPCPTGWLVELNPGTYGDAAALSNLTKASGPCPGKVVRLKPGNYYFDFNFDGSQGNCAADPNPCTWRIDDAGANVVGGTPKGWDPGAPTRPVVPAPGGCQTDQDTVAVDTGVQLIFGGQSRLDVTAGKVELCAQPSATAQQIAIYGLKDGGAAPGPTLAATPNAATVPLSPSANAFQVGDSLTAGADLASSSSARIGALALSGFGSSSIPPDATIDGVTLRIAHAENGDIDRLRATVTRPDGPPIAPPLSFDSGGQGCNPATSLCVHPVLASDTIDLKAQGINSVPALNGLVVTYESFLASGDATGNEALDGIAIDVAYTPQGGTGQLGTLSPTQPPGLVPLSPPTNALQIGESPTPFTANAALAAGSATTAALTLTGYNVPPVPPGSRLDTVRLRVAHSESGDVDRLRATVVRPNAPVIPIDSAGPVCDPATSLCVHPGPGNDSIDLKARGIDSVAALSGLAVSYEAFLAAGGVSGNEALDGIAIEVTYTPPALRALEGCLTAPYPGAGSCALVRTAGADAKVFVQGTVYAPTAALDIAMANVNAPVLGRGVIARSLRLGVTPAAGYTGPSVAVPSNKPRRAVLTLGTHPGEEGIHQLPVDRGPLPTKGGIFSASTIRNDNTDSARALVVQGDASAVGNCDEDRIRATVLRCANKDGPANPTDGADPDYPKATETIPPPASVPACPGWLVELDPGTYGDATALSNLTKSGGPCQGKVVRLKPGNYYFDFNADGSQGDCATDANLCTWKIDDAGANVVGGTPKGWVADPAAPTRAAVPAPGGCKTDQDTLEPGTGVQLIFGGQSRLDVSDGKMELCAQPSATAQEITLYGLKQPAPTSSTVVVPTAAGVPLSPSANAFEIGDSLDAEASLTSGSVTSTALGLTGFDASSIPADATLNSVTLRVAHADTADIERVRATVSYSGSAVPITIESGAPCELCVHQAAATDAIDLKVKGISTAAALAGLEVNYEAFLAPGAGTSATAALDGIAIEVSYSPAGGGSAQTATLVPTGPEGLVPLSSPANALQIGEAPTPLTSNAALATGGASAAGLTLAGFDAGGIPAGSTLDSVVLRVAHSDTGDIDRLRTRIFRPGAAPIVIESAAPACDPATSLCVHPAPGADRIDLKGLGIDNLGALSGLGVSYEALLAGGAGKSGTEVLDGIAIDVTYTPPSFRPLTGCVTAAPYPSTAGSCALVKVAGSDSKMFVQGTVYAPTAALDLSMANVGAPVFGRGVIARALRLGITPSGCYGGPIATVLDDPPGEEIGPGVVFTACVNGTPRLRARVAFPPGDPAEVKGWSVLR